MYSASVTALTVVAMLIHSVVGCCWHHAHDDCCRDDAPAACECAAVDASHGDSRVADADCAGHSHGCSHVAHADGGAGATDGDRESCGCEQGDQHRHRACAEQHCSFISGRSIELPELLPVTGIVPVDCVVATSMLVNAHGRERPDLFPPPTDAARRALTQVWRL